MEKETDSRLVYARAIYEFCNRMDTAKSISEMEKILDSYDYDRSYDGRGDWMTRWVKGERIPLQTVQEIFYEMINHTI